jgi:hypothetical protein
VLTSDPTSDSSDTGSSNKDSCNVEYRASGSEGNSGKQVVHFTLLMFWFLLIQNLVSEKLRVWCKKGFNSKGCLIGL